MRVYVLNQRGKPLMPTTPRKARILLKQGKAKAANRTPFTIQLTIATGEAKQPISLGVDAGSKVIGLSATTESREVYAGEVRLRSDVTDLLATRRENRRARRNRKTRYRKPRFLNRTRAKKERWLAPSIRQKIGTHLKAVEAVCKLLPITKITVETAAFDIQKIKNPEIEGDGYQKGDQLGFWNVREYVLFRDGHKCRHCGGKSHDKVLNVHHIESRKTGGDAPNNLVTLCETCHRGYHDGRIQLKTKRGVSFKDAAFMGIMRWSFYERLKNLYPNVGMTYGYLTKHTRISNDLEKDHAVDARCISGNPTVFAAPEIFLQKAVRRHNRQIHKSTIYKNGYRKLNQAPKYVYGFRLFDKVSLGGGEAFVFGRRSTGSFDVRKIDGTRLSAGVTHKKLKLLEKSKTILTERETRFLPGINAEVSTRRAR